MKDLGNLSIMGESAMNGGEYRKVSVMGSLSLSDQVKARQISVMGDLNSDSDIICQKISVMGSATLKQLKSTNTISVMGQMNTTDINAEVLDVKGEVVCTNNLECGELEVRGAVNVGNLLSAERLWIKSTHPSKAKEIGGKSIKVRSRVLFTGTVLSADMIEFDEIDIECVKADVVRGANIIIGKNCKINLVEYTDKLVYHPNAQIGRKVKI